MERDRRELRTCPAPNSLDAKSVSAGPRPDKPRISLRRALPTGRARPTLEGTDDIRGNPAAIEVAGLRPYKLVADVAVIYARRVEGDEILDCLVARSRIR